MENVTSAIIKFYDSIKSMFQLHRLGFTQLRFSLRIGLGSFHI